MRLFFFIQNHLVVNEFAHNSYVLFLFVVTYVRYLILLKQNKSKINRLEDIYKEVSPMKLKS